MAKLRAYSCRPADAPGAAGSEPSRSVRLEIISPRSDLRDEISEIGSRSRLTSHLGEGV